MAHVVTSTLDAVLAKHPNLEFLHYHWVDYVGVLRSRVLTIHHAKALASAARTVRLTPVCSLPLHGGAAPAGFIGAAGSNALVPDWNSVTTLSKTHASVMCNVSEQYIFHLDFDTSKPFLRCPRTQLQILVQAAKEDLQLELLAGIELEFYLIKLGKESDAGEGSAELDALNAWSTASGLRGSEGHCVESCVRNLQEAGIHVEQYHMERGFQQFEISLAPLPVLRATDICVQSREIIKRAALSQGYLATFYPRPFPNRSPNGLHVHLSLANTPKPTTDQFLAGILERLPLLCAFGLGSEASFSRVEQGTMGEWVAWGTENRHVPIRQIHDGHWELRCIDSTSNIYLTIAAFIAVGMMGVKQGARLRWGDCRNHVRNLDDAERATLGIDTLLPKDLNTALEILEREVVKLEQLIPEALMRLYVTARRKEKDAYATMSENQRRAAYLREY